MSSNKEKDVVIAKWYVKQVLDGIDCVDQTNLNLFDINTCYYLNMDFYHLECLTKHILDKCHKENSQEYVNKLLESATIKSLYNDYLQPYKVICLRHVNQEFVDWPHEFAKDYLNTVISDIINLADSRDYPKGLQTTSDYFEDLFEDHIVFHKSITVNDFSKVAKIFDNSMLQLRCKIKKQRELDGI
jgi:hypothetical protein